MGNKSLAELLLAHTEIKRKDNQGFRNGQQDQNTFSAVFFPQAMMSEAVFVTICLDFCAHFFFGVPHIILIFCD